MQRIVVVLVILLAASSASASSRRVAYSGIHPIPAANGGGLCAIEGPHVHLYRPEHAEEMFRVIGGAYVFVGDPVPYGYEGPKHAYAGPHPVPIDGSDRDVFCYLDGPHYHAYVSPASVGFVERGGAYWYVGAWPRSFQREGPRLTRINVFYKPLVYVRPVIVVAPPLGYHVPVIVVIDEPLTYVVIHHRYKHKHKHKHHHEDDDDDDD
jgi:hypothetical protein